MKKGKIILSLFSIILSGFILILSLASSELVGERAVDITINGVSGSIQRFSDNILSFFNNQKNENNNLDSTNTNELVYIGGYPIGLKLYADGVVIVGTEAVDTETGSVNPGKSAGLKTGDIIKKINGRKVNMNTEVSECIENSNGESLTFTIERDSNIFDVSFSSVFSVSENKFKAGLWIRDSSAGIGTVTFCTQDGYFASLGHAVCDIDTKTCIPISRGECTIANITGFIKGVQGAAGELCGYLENDAIGNVYSNCDIGVYGTFNELPDAQLYPIAKSDEIVKGKATIITTLDTGGSQEFEIEIQQVNSSSTDNKNFVIKVTDENLISKTGGIVQGMSGSPIIQDGKLVGAVTHVLVNDPTKGYAIFAENMLDTVKQVIGENTQKDAS